jgi:hypothetical protein
VSDRDSRLIGPPRYLSFTGCPAIAEDGAMSSRPSILRTLQGWLADRFGPVQYPPERRQLSIASKPQWEMWFLWLLLQMTRLWLLIVGGVVLGGMLLVGYCFVWAWWKYG